MKPVSFVEIIIGHNQDNNIIFPRAMWQAFIERRLERFVQSIEPSSLSVQEPMIENRKNALCDCGQINTARNMSI